MKAHLIMLAIVFAPLQIPEQHADPLIRQWIGPISALSTERIGQQIKETAHKIGINTTKGVAYE